MTDDVRGLKDKAAELMAKGKLPKALEAWQAVVAAAPQDVAAEQKVAELQAKLGHKAQAIQTYERVAERYASQGHFFKASAVCRLVLGLDPAHQKTQERIASLYAKQRAPTKPAVPVATPAAPAPAPTPAPAGLPSIPLFSTLSVEELKAVLGGAMEVRAYAAGELIVAEGAPGDSMFALVEGSAGIFRGFGTPTQKRVAELSSGDIFGEVALLSGAPRVATVAADGDAVALEFPRNAMARVIEQHPNIGQQLEAFCQERLLSNALRASPILRALPDEERSALSSAFEAAAFVHGQRILSEGEKADSVFILVRGACEVTHSSGERYPELREGDLFGELSALTGEAPTATVRAKGTALTLKLPATDFRLRVLAHPQAKAAVEALAQARLARTEQLDLEYGIDVRI